MSKKKVSDNERVRQLATLPAVQALKTEVEARAFARAGESIISVSLPAGSSSS